LGSVDLGHPPFLTSVYSADIARIRGISERGMHCICCKPFVSISSGAMSSSREARKARSPKCAPVTVLVFIILPFSEPRLDSQLIGLACPEMKCDNFHFSVLEKSTICASWRSLLNDADTGADWLFSKTWNS
jgi:hypothetical protein